VKDTLAGTTYIGSMALYSNEELRLDPKKYTKVQWTHPDNWLLYMNKMDGLWIHTISWDKRGDEVTGR